VFFSKIFINAEKHYWPTELKMADIVWAIKKIRNIIEFSIKSIIFYTNYSAVIDIVKIISLTSSNTDKLNNRFIRANQYLSQFQLDVRYKLEKYYIISDVLFRLLTKPELISNLHKSDDIFDDIDNFHVILIKISDIFKNKLR
jgi:hypothetical protein